MAATQVPPLIYTWIQYLLKGIKKPEAGVLLPADGLAVCTSSAIQGNLASSCFSLAGQHKFRKASDLARPI